MLLRANNLVRALLVFTCVALVPTVGSSGQPNEQSASDLLNFLSYQTERPNKATLMLGPECGLDLQAAREDRPAARSLVQLGGSAVPKVEAAFASMEEFGERSRFILGAPWFLYAYARIEGRAGVPRLKRMILSPKLNSLEYFLDNAIALALGLTSFVNRLETKGEVFCRAREPRDALNSLIIAWQRNDRPSLEAALGPDSIAALNRWLGVRAWTQARADLWKPRAGGVVAVGYRFDTLAQWAQPEETLDDVLAQSRTVVDLAKLPVNPQIDTQFSNADGGNCGSRRIGFITSQDQMRRVTYLVDDRDIGGLLGMISACAIENGR